jgi:hypothetical protein
MEFPFVIPEEIEGILILSFGEARTFVLDLLSPDGVLRDDVTIHLNPNGGTYICLCTLRRECYDVRWSRKTQGFITYCNIPSRFQDLYIIAPTGRMDIPISPFQEVWSLGPTKVRPIVLGPAGVQPLFLRNWSAATLLSMGIDDVAMASMFPVFSRNTLKVETVRTEVVILEHLFTCEFAYHDWAEFLSTHDE